MVTCAECLMLSLGRLCFLKPGGLGQKKLILENSDLSLQKNFKIFVLFATPFVSSAFSSLCAYPIIYDSSFSSDKME
jgi:hypothetical protein